MKFRLGTVATEGALERADDRVRRVGPQILVAALAIGAQLKQGNLMGIEGRNLERNLGRNPAHGAVSNALVNPS